MKLPVLTGLQVIKRLHKAGFIVVRQKGSHVRLEKRSGENLIKVTVPVHNKPLKPGTLSRIIKDTGLNVEAFNN